MAIESNKRVCKVCNQEKDRILVGKFDNRNKKYQDESGKTWNGNICPSCHKDNIKRRMQAMRVLKKITP